MLKDVRRKFIAIVADETRDETAPMLAHLPKRVLYMYEVARHYGGMLVGIIGALGVVALEGLISLAAYLAS